MTRIKYVSVILPLAIPKTYSYSVPEDLISGIQFGIRVEVPLRNKLYAAIVVEIHDKIDLPYKEKPIVSVIDEIPIIHQYQYDFWKWLAHYYCCTIGEVMHVALPGGLRLSSETKIIMNEHFEDDFTNLNEKEYIIAEAVSIRNQLTISEIQDILDQKTVYPIIKQLIDKGVISIYEELIQKFKPKVVGFVRLAEPYESNKELLQEAMDKVERSAKQTQSLLAYLSLARGTTDVPKSAIYKMANSDSSVLKAMEKKGIFELFEKEVSRLEAEEADGHLPPLSEQQVDALKLIHQNFENQRITLLHGVTGSGKTRVYLELIQEVLAQGKQVLYLLPEIALTTQIVSRVTHIFGEAVGFFHSRMNNNERVELWKSAYKDKQIVIGARSSLFLPFSNLGLIIVDEEHDPSFKQQDPSPRYNARDAAVFLATYLKTNIILGTATPSLETYKNVKDGKYDLVEMKERHGNIALPEMQVIDLKYTRKTNQMNGFFSKPLLTAIDDALLQKQQVLLFQNKRGYSRAMQCGVCGWTGECLNCDVTLTYHKFFDELKCHYCGYRQKNPEQCPACGNDVLEEIGVGTERIQNDIQAIYPENKVSRLDYDTAKSKNAFTNIIGQFANREIDILVGTQMITKGLDFENIGLVGVINADAALQFADFRAGERAFQLFTQVAGRAGRRKKQGKVLIQTYNPQHPVIIETLAGAYDHFYQREIKERNQWIYPPFYRMIVVELKHKNPRTVEDAARYISMELRKPFGKRISNPAQPGVARVKNLYIQLITIRYEKDATMSNAIKSAILQMKSKLRKSAGFKSVRFKIDVDPY